MQNDRRSQRLIVDRPHPWWNLLDQLDVGEERAKDMEKTENIRCLHPRKLPADHFEFPDTPSRGNPTVIGDRAVYIYLVHNAKTLGNCTELQANVTPEAVGRGA